MKINKKISGGFFVFLGCLFPIIPIALLFTFFNLPKEASPSVIPLTGTWNAQYKDINKPVTLPGLFYSTDGKGLIPDYKGQTWDVSIQKKVALKDSLLNEDLFLVICGTMYQTGRVLVNGEFVGDIGVFQKHRKFGTIQGIDGFLIEKKLLKPTNEITLKLETDDLTSFGLNDQRLYLGLVDVLRPYYEKNLFLNNFFNFGVVFFSLFMLIILGIMTFTEWKSPDRSKYLVTGLFILSSLSYNLFYSGSFVNYFIPSIWLNSFIIFSVTLFTLANLEFIQRNLVGKVNIAGKINRVICLLTGVYFIVFTSNNYIINLLWGYWGYYVIVSFMYGFYLIIKSVLKTKNPYGFVMGFANLLLVVSVINDFLSNLAIINTPLVFNVNISAITIIGTIIVIAEFVRISNTLKEKVEERTKELKQARDALWGEMELAKKIQTVLLPQKPAIPGYEISASMLTASEVGGDYYDIITVQKRGAPLHWAVIGDVSGHGVPAGLVMMMVQTAIHTVLEENPEVLPSNLLTVINKVIASNIKQLGEDKYMTITVFAVGEDGKFKFSGMHQPLVIYRHGKKAIERIDTKGMWIGIMDDITGMVEDDEVKLEKSDVLLLYTDGVTEAWEKGAVKDVRGQSNMFGDKNLDKALFNSAERPPEEIRNGVLQALEGYDFADDVTLVVLKRKD